MSRFRSDGSVLSNNTPTHSQLSQYHIDREQTIFRAMVVDVYYVDDQRNITRKSQNPAVLYQCQVIGGMDEGKILDNCKLADFLGGQYNYAERVLRKATNSGNGDKGKQLSEQDGDIVYVGFINADSKYPVILGLDTQPLDRDKTGATKADGQRRVWEYNGVKDLITKTGQWIRTRIGGTIDTNTNAFKPDSPPNASKVVEEIWEDGKSTKKVGNNITITEDSNAGQVTIQTTGGNQIIIDQAGEITIQASTKVNITSPEVDVGDAAALSVTLFEKLKAHFDSHSHPIPGNVGPPVTGLPLAPMVDLIGSQTVKAND